MRTFFMKQVVWGLVFITYLCKKSLSFLLKKTGSIKRVPLHNDFAVVEDHVLRVLA